MWEVGTGGLGGGEKVWEVGTGGLGGGGDSGWVVGTRGGIPSHRARKLFLSLVFSYRRALIAVPPAFSSLPHDISATGSYMANNPYTKVDRRSWMLTSSASHSYRTSLMVTTRPCTGAASQPPISSVHIQSPPRHTGAVTPPRLHHSKKRDSATANTLHTSVPHVRRPRRTRRGPLPQGVEVDLLVWCRGVV